MQLPSRKFWKKTARVALVITGVLLLLLIAVSLYVLKNKQKFITVITQQLKEHLQGEVTIKDGDVTFWKSFPYVEVRLQDVVIADTLYHQPLLQVQQLGIRFNIYSITGKQKSISTLRLQNGKLHIFTDSTGYSNDYLLKIKKGNDSASGKGSLVIKKVILLNFSFLNDKTKQKRIEFTVANAVANIEKQDSILHIQMQEKCLVQGLGFNLPKGSYLENKTLNADWNIDLNPTAGTLSFGETSTTIGDHNFLLKGFFSFKDSGYFKLDVATKQINFNEAKDLLTVTTRTALEQFKVSAPVDADATIEGQLAPHTDPLVTVHWFVKNNDIATPFVSLNNCTFTGGFNNEVVKGLPRLDENSAVVFNDFSGNWGTVPLAGKEIYISNLTTPSARFQLHSNCSLQQLSERIASKTLAFTQGAAVIQLKYNGPLDRDPILLKKLEIEMSVENGTIKYKPKNIVFTNCKGIFTLAGNNLQINKLECDVNKNHFEITVDSKELSKLSKAEAGKASITCSVFTPSLQLGDFKTLFKPGEVSNNTSAVSTNSTVAQIDDMLETGNLGVHINALKVMMDKFEATDVKAQVVFEQHDWQIENASLKHAGGSLNLNAKVHNTDDTHQAVTNVVITNMDVSRLFYAFDNFGQKGINSNNLKGTVNTIANISLGLDNAGSIVPGTIEGEVNFSIKNGSLINYGPIEDIKKIIFKNRDLSNISFAEIKDKLDIKKDNIYINRMEIASSAMLLFVEGNYSILPGNANPTDISIQVPLSNLKKIKDGFVPVNKGVDAKVGPSIYLRAKGSKDGSVKIGLDVFKKLRGGNNKDKK